MIGAITIGIVFTVAMTSIINSSTNSLLLLSTVQSEKSISSPHMDSGGSISLPSTFSVNVTLEGTKNLRVAELKNSDVFVVFVSDNGTRVAKRLDYLAASDGWSINRILVGNLVGDLVNPVSLALGTGMWDPGETLELSLAVSDSIDSNRGWYITMITIDGGTSSRAFGPGGS
ncbi:MAG: hypothetical protein LUP94_02520 [Candidatus Methanomethylicus sp.]|nr:hypothetical protein [Candidatus Methanomethylicus sp.]